MTRAWEGGDYYDDDVMVCVTHRCFVPCRRDAPHSYSTGTEDVEAVRRYQQYKEGHPNDVEEGR